MISEEHQLEGKMQNNATCIGMTREAGHVARIGERRSAYRVFFSWGRLRERAKLENLAHD
jgi:hypothetical protein